MLRFVPEGIHTRAGSMTELPFEDGFFDAAYATESLEHAVEIEQAVSELCRVVKPAGASPSSTRTRRNGESLQTPEWSAGSRARGWSGCCGGIAGRYRAGYISYWEDVEPDGLFLAWLAVK